jgi:protein-L-isoaspartate O-methyltransferase
MAPTLPKGKGLPVGTGTEKYYQARAREYDAVYEKAERQADLASLRAWLPPVLDGRRVLEVAAGTGYWTAVYADLAQSVLATDISSETLDVARARRNWPGSVRFAQADAFRFDSVAGAFDAAFAGFFWSHVPVGSLDSFLSGLAGQLERPATLVFIDNRYIPGSNHPVTRTDVDGNTYQQRRLTDGSTWEVIKNFPAPEEIQKRLAGLGRTEVSELHYYWTAVCTLGEWSLGRSRPVISPLSCSHELR